MSGTQQYVGPNAVYAGGESMIQQIIPAYLYTQYANDDNLQALFMSQNDLATQFLLWFNTLNLPIYTGGIVSGALLAWVAEGLYGMLRPPITTGAVKSTEGINSAPIGTVVINGRRISSNETLQSVNDDIFRRIITWNFYKGDGFTFNTTWLKRRVLRFMLGANGIAPVIDKTDWVNITTSGTAFTVVVNSVYLSSSVATMLNSLIQSGACITPFQYTFTVSAAAQTLFDDGGVLYLSPNTGYPASTSGLTTGQLWSNAGVISVYGTTTPSPTAAPVYFGLITASALLTLTGANLPLTKPRAGSLQLWNNGGEVSIA